MGNSQGSSSDSPLAKLYKAYDDKVSTQLKEARLSSADLADLKAVLEVKGVSGAGEFLGGCDGTCLGGYDALQDYGNSLFSKAKEKLIREIAEEVFSALKISGAKNAKTAPISDVVAHLKKLSPNPSKGKRFNEAFNSSGSKQKAVCHALANAINNNYGGRIINMEASDSDMCNQVAEVMYSLLTGLHTEFLNVAGDVTRIMKNMQTVESALTAAYKKQVELVEASNDARLKEQSENSAKLYNEIKAEYDRQAAVLANLMNVSIGPAAKSIISSLEDNRDFAGLVRDLKAEAGTSAFGDKLGHLLSGISTVAHSAELIDRALRKIGMSVNEFKSARNASELRSKVLSTIMKDSPNSKRLDEMMAAAQIIFNNNYDHDAIGKMLHSSSSKKKGRGEFSGGVDGAGSGSDSESDDGKSSGSGSGSDSEVEGGDDVLPTYWQKKSLSKKLDNKAKYRDMVLKDFRKLLKSHYRDVVDAANPLAAKVGKSIPVSDQLDYFVRAFSELPNLDRENLHVALSGYAKDSVSREERDKFMNSYMLLDEAIEPLLKGPEGPMFKRLQSAVNTMVKSIDDFSEKMVKALTEIHVDRPDEIQSALKKSANLFYGSSDSGEDLFGSGSWVAFDKVKNEMKYFYSIANIKTNMSRFADDIKSYSDDYEQLLGEEAGWLINTIKKEFLDLINYTNPAKEWANFSAPLPPDSSRAKAIHTALRDFRGVHADNVAVADQAHKNLVALWTTQMNAKENMVKVAQAVDLYLKSFTDGIARNPDAVGSVIKMLDQVDIVARWFTEKSGSNLSYLFEMFPHTVSIAQPAGAASIQPRPQYSYGAEANAPIKPDGGYNIPDKAHYYEYVEEKVMGRQLPGNPFLGRPLGLTPDAQFKEIMGLTDKTIKGMRALENILSAFASVGSKFGDLDPQSRTFMNPGQIFNALVEYIKASAFTSQFAPSVGDMSVAAQKTRADRLTAAIYHSKTYVKEISTTGFPSIEIPSIDKDSHRVAAVNDRIQWSQSAAADRATVINGAAALIGNVNVGLHGILTGNNTDCSIAPSTAALTDAVNAGAGAAAAVAGVTAAARAEIPNGVAAVRAATNFAGAAAAAAGGAAAAAAMNAAVDAAVDAAGVPGPQYKYQSMAMSAIPYDSDETKVSYWKYHDSSNRGDRLDNAGWQDAFYDTDLLFQLSIKSLVSKIFTVVDAYRLFNRPTMNRESHYSLNPLRTIIGGSTHVPVIMEAAELYLRLPLLAEWYRERYGFKSDLANPNAWRLSIVPSVDGTWSDFISVVFDKAREVKEGNYTEPQAQEIIVSINNIHKAYKSKYPKATNRNIINSFILEMNRIFGFLKQQDINAYINQRREFLKDHSAGDPEDFVDYDILNANDQFGSRPAPSDKFVNVGLKQSDVNRINMQKLQSEVVRLRKEMDAELNSVLVRNSGPNGDPRVSFGETLRNYKKELAAAKNSSDQYQIVLQIIQGANKTVNLSTDKLIMVHEAVAAPLAALYGVYKVLLKYNSLVHGASIPNIAEWNTLRTPGVVAADTLTRTLDTNTNFREAYRQFLERKYDKLLSSSKNNMLNSMVLALTGNHNPGHPIDDTNCGYVIVAPNDQRITNDDIDAPHMLQDLLNAIAELSVNSGRLVSCNVGNGGNINLDFSPLQDLCANLLNQVKTNVHKLRTAFPPGSPIINRYETATSVGSVRWLEENLMEVLFNDRDQCGLSTGYTAHLVKSLERLMVNEAASVNITLTSGFPTVDNALRGLIYYEHKQAASSLPPIVASCDTRKFPWNVIPMKKTAEDPDEKKVLTLVSSGTAVPNANTNAMNALFTTPVMFFEYADTVDKFNDASIYGVGGSDILWYNSLLTRFNKLVHMYLQMNLEDGSLKIYTPLFESFMNGAASREVLQGLSFPNAGNMIVGADSDAAGQAAPTGGGALMAPPDGVVLYTTNALAMRAMATSVATLGSVQKKKHAYDNVAEIPEFLKDRMRVNLPYFSKMFQEVQDRAEFLKRVLTYTNVKGNITSCVAASANNKQVRGVLVGAPLKDMCPGAVPLSTQANADYLNGLLTRFIELSGSIKKCCDSVYKELNDKPVPFLEPSKDFIADYKRKNGVLPIMPASLILAPSLALNRKPDLADPSEACGLMLPTVANGSNVYKFNNAAKLLLSDLNVEPTIDHFPGAKEIYNMYAEAIDGNNITSAEYANTIKLMVKLAKFLNTGSLQARMYGRPQRGITEVLTQHNSGSVFGSVWEPEYTTDVSNVPAAPADNFGILPLVVPTVSALIEIVENTNNKYSKERLAQVLGSKINDLNNDTRADLRVFNILDMNVVPINVHAFMREIPFVNILNYAYTFDRMVHDFVLPSYVKNLGSSISSDNIMIKANSDVTNPRELLVKLLVHPYADLGTDSPQYFGLLASLFNGNDDMKLGRPRYLSDQLWHKALLTSSVQLGYGNSASIATLPAVANTNLALGPAGYEAQRGIVTASRKSTAMSSDMTKKIFHAVVLGSLANNDDKAVMKAILQGPEGAPNPAIIPANALAMVTGARFNRATIKAGVLAVNNLAKADNAAFIAALQPVRLTPDVKKAIDAFNNKIQALQNDTRHDRRAHAYQILDIIVRHMIEGKVAGDNRNVSLGRVTVEITRLTGINELQESKDIVNYTVNTLCSATSPVRTAPEISLRSNSFQIAEDVKGTGGYTDIGEVYTTGVRVVQGFCKFVRSIGIDISVWVENLAINCFLIELARDDAAARDVLGLRLTNSLIAVGTSRRSFTLEDYLANAVLLGRRAANAGADKDETLGFVVGAQGVIPGVYQNGVLNALNSYWASLDDVQGTDGQKFIERASLEMVGDPVQAEGLKYRKNDRWAVVNTGGKNMDVGNVVYCAELGRMRFDTKLVRNLTWLVQLQRIMRVVLTNHLSWINTPVVRGLKIADAKITEFESNEEFDEADYNGSKYNVV